MYSEFRIGASGLRSSCESIAEELVLAAVGLPERLLALLALGDVLDEADQPATSARVPDLDAAKGEPPHDTIHPPRPELRGVGRRALFAGRQELRRRPRAVLREDEVRPALLDFIGGLRRHAQEGKEAVLPELLARLDIDLPRRGLGDVQGKPEPSFGRLQLREHGPGRVLPAPGAERGAHGGHEGDGLHGSLQQRDVARSGQRVQGGAQGGPPSHREDDDREVRPGLLPLEQNP